MTFARRIKDAPRCVIALQRFARFTSLALFLGIAGCDSPGAAARHGDPKEAAPAHRFSGAYPIRVTATTGMVADLAKHIGGEHVAVTQLMGEGIDPHLYKASPGDVSQLNGADMIFYSGLHLEGKMGDVLARQASKKPAVAVAEGIAKQRLLEVALGVYDPHVWFDVALWSETLASVEAALENFDPPHAAEYRRRAADYRAELAELDAECRKRISEIPREHRVLVTAHDAFHYFGRAYGVEVKAIQGISTQAEAGIKKINELVDFIAARKIKAVFVETSVNERNIEALVEGCQAQGHAVTIGGQLFSDAMGRPGTPEGTYPGMVRHNVEAIAKALE
ncbi:MAG TPA: zinc ABC transporter substrate-binding protein [Pirellulales bacterium]|nr:zinc ABC transporter substrate-binding protein [Pirellulales bacterium]